MPDSLIKVLLHLIETRWYRRSTLLILLFVAVAILLPLFSAIEITKISWLEIAVGIVVLDVLTLFWVTTSRLPKAPQGKVGFVVAIKTETVKQQDQLAKDFVLTLRELLDNSSLKYKFSLVEYPQHYARQIDSSDDAIKFLHISRCHFMVFGRARTRRIQGEDRHVLNLEGAVTHKPISKEMQKPFSAEFSELFPRRVIIPQENDLFSFEITAEWLNLVAKYVIGIAALLSGDTGYAQDLFEHLEKEVKSFHIDLPAIIKIRRRIPTRLAAIYLEQAIASYWEWKQAKDPEPLNRMKSYLDDLERVAPGNSHGHNLRSIWFFVARRDIAGAKGEIEKGRSRDVIWRYNYAFLLAYEGNLEKAFNEYKRASKVPAEASVLLDIEEFICWILEKEPDKIQLYFCLGLFNFFSKGDNARALQDFESFLEVTPPDQFCEQRRLAEIYMLELQKRLEKGN